MLSCSSYTANGEPSTATGTGESGGRPKSIKVRVRSVSVTMPSRLVLAEVSQPGSVVASR